MPETPENPEQPAAAGEPSAPAPTPAPGPAPAQPDPRPRPAYGEYAPEGWEWKPEDTAAGSTAPSAGGPAAGNSAAGSSAAGGAGAAHTGGGSAAPYAGGSATPGTVPGVPHNLGAGSKLPARGARSAPAQPLAPQSGQQHPQPQAPQQQAPQQQAPQQQASQQPGAPYRGDAPRYMGPAVPGSQPAGPRQVRPVDRVFTVLLLVFGAFGAVQSAFALMGLETAFKIMGEAPGVEGLTMPAWLGTSTKVIGIAILAFYGMMLVYTIRRLRAGKLTFWVPLLAGVIATLVLVVIYFVAFLNTPELMEVIQDPQKANDLIDYMRGVGQP